MWVAFLIPPKRLSFHGQSVDSEGAWCRQPDLNRYEMQNSQQILSLMCLPIPPRRHVGKRKNMKLRGVKLFVSTLYLHYSTFILFCHIFCTINFYFIFILMFSDKERIFFCSEVSIDSTMVLIQTFFSEDHLYPYCFIVSLLSYGTL